MSNICIAGLQWGDEGKGKFVDYFAKNANIVVRFQGGNNAGHTIVTDGVSYKLSLLPSGILHKGKIAFIASGVVVDLESLYDEIERIKARNIEISNQNLKIAENISIIIPLYKKLDLLLENLKGDKKIGTTGRGIGIAYQDKVGRRSIRMCDLFEEETIKDRLDNILQFYSPILEKYEKTFNLEETKKETLNYIQKYRDYFKNHLVSSNFLNDFKNENILFEGAQGAMLDISFGTYPFVTSSNTLASEVYIGAGFGGKLDKVFGVAKAYCTRVGAGPFPSEDFGEEGEIMQKKGAEFGTVTGRIRRCGFLDLVALKQIIELSGITDIILTKIDVLNSLKTIKVCTSYMLDGKEIKHIPSSEGLQSRLIPVYTELEGWGDGYSFKNFEELPIALKNYIQFIESYTKIPVSVLSFGAEREESLTLNKIW
jgi:adenylosuccinate synthase